MKITHLNALRALEATLRKGSFTTAAKELGVTPAAVGQRIQTLEDYIGRKLFERSPSGATPTAEARKMQPALTLGFATLAGVLDEMQPGTSSNRVSVTMPESFAENWFGLVVSKFAAMHPKADIRLDASNRDYDLSSENFDFAIRYGQPLGDPFEETLLFGDSVQPVCSPEFASRHQLAPSHVMPDLSSIPLIHVLNRTSDPGWVGFDGWGRAFGIDPAHLSQGIRFSKAGSGLQSAIAGEGLVMAGLVESFHALADGRLTMPFGTSRRYETEYQYRLLKHRDAAMSITHAAFVAWLLDRAQQHKRDVAELLERFSD
ncbi:LysR family transcriptional regulator [Jannaschia seohaensis]|uniref:LysR family glycine cleavage system transcriptional activator n=1 Tax=Jannaschia seohaensis TaxID=475081 RepID=A0A2Y9C993_9RHOB|nr:LysR family transcriptional regulator [Jannaschia seohaensis]PWJ10044.1 LysR family glycine cleavage system transcriptional activator [Jannaschia seohaensis]SSA51793.1 LysR family transcriptional regulator, glycine cleavage system transcriptional activator [Jannaschia seohaensis]